MAATVDYATKEGVARALNADPNPASASMQVLNSLGAILKLKEMARQGGADVANSALYKLAQSETAALELGASVVADDNNPLRKQLGLPKTLGSAQTIGKLLLARSNARVYDAILDRELSRTTAQSLGKDLRSGLRRAGATDPDIYVLRSRERFLQNALDADNRFINIP